MKKKKVINLYVTSQEFDLVSCGELKEFYMGMNRQGVKPGAQFDEAHIYVTDRRGRKLVAKVVEISENSDNSKRKNLIRLGKVISVDELKKKIPYHEAPLKIMCLNKFNKHYLYYRKRPDLWVMFHNAVYEANTGHRPTKGERVVFLDGDVTNCHFSNLKLYTTTELMQLRFEHNEMDLSEDRLVEIIKEHEEEIELVRKYFKIDNK
jgi:hypothetical protein